MSTASDELRAASARLRERAQRAGQGIGAAIREGTCDLFGNVRPDPAAMDPAVGTALADWLDEEADRRDACLVAAIQIWGNAEHPDAVAWLTTGLGKGSAPALGLARQINTGSRP